MRLNKFLKEELSSAEFNFTYPNSDKDISTFFHEEEQFNNVVVPKKIQVEIDSFRKHLEDLKKMMTTKQVMYDKDVDSLV
jgi:hypothetical protein